MPFKNSVWNSVCKKNDEIEGNRYFLLIFELIIWKKLICDESNYSESTESTDVATRLGFGLLTECFPWVEIFFKMSSRDLRSTVSRFRFQIYLFFHCFHLKFFKNHMNSWKISRNAWIQYNQYEIEIISIQYYWISVLRNSLNSVWYWKNQYRW